MWPHSPRTSRGRKRYITIVTNRCNFDEVRATDPDPGEDAGNLKAIKFPFTIFTSAVTVGRSGKSLE